MIISNFLTKAELLTDIPEFSEDYFNIDRKIIGDQLKKMTDILRDDIICFIEYPYVDKYYRDSYYHFFSRKHSSYNRNSIRISFFHDSLQKDKYFEIETNKEIEEKYFGFISLRPTTYRIIGHSFLNPQLLINNDFVCCLTKKSVLVNGRKLSIHGFPFCSQDNESITCSEAAIINLFDYFGNKYSEYSTILPSQVAKILSKQSYQRQLPAHGLPTENISYVLKKMGFGTVVYSSNDKNKSIDIYESDEFREMLYAYVESGIPVIATLSSGKSHHAVLVIGRENIKQKIIYGKRHLFDFGMSRHTFAEGFTKLLVMNDNNPPYEIVDYDKPIYDREFSKYYKFKSFIVPLHSKVHIDAYQFKNFFFIILKSLESDAKTKHIQFRNKDGYIFRYYLTSSRSYKDYIANSKELSEEFKTIVINKSMPKFIWVGEIINGKEIAPNQEVQSIIVVDATESGLTGNLIFATNSKYLIMKNLNSFDSDNKHDTTNKGYQIFEFDKEKFYTFVNNLKGTHTKWQS